MSTTCSIVGYRDPAKSIRWDDGTLSSERARILANRYELPSDKFATFENVLAQIVELYKDPTPPRTVASKQEVRELRKALVTARRYLKRGDMLTRLHDDPGSDPAREGGQKKINRSTSKHLVQSIDELLPVVTAAGFKEGRAFAGAARRNAKARAAAKLLRDFWVKVLHRDSSLSARGGVMTRGLRFVLDCLHEFDPAVKEASIRDLTPFKRSSRH